MRETRKEGAYSEGIVSPNSLINPTKLILTVDLSPSFTVIDVFVNVPSIKALLLLHMKIVQPLSTHQTVVDGLYADARSTSAEGVTSIVERSASQLKGFACPFSVGDRSSRTSVIFASGLTFLGVLGPLCSVPPIIPECLFGGERAFRTNGLLWKLRFC